MWYQQKLLTCYGSDNDDDDNDDDKFFKSEGSGVIHVLWNEVRFIGIKENYGGTFASKLWDDCW